MDQAAKARKRVREYYKKNKENIRRRRNKEYSPSKQAQQHRQRLLRWKNAVYDRLGRECVHCGYADMRALQLDHIRGGGCSKTRGFSTITYYRMLALSKRLEKDMQVLCSNCNWIKRYTNKEV